MNEMRLFDTSGKRLYLNASERTKFLSAAHFFPPEIRTLCETLHYTGCRLSEALELTPERVDMDGEQITLRSLKKRRDDVYRTVPVPLPYLENLNSVHRLRQAVKIKKARSTRLWPWGRPHGWKVVKAVMAAAEIEDGPHRAPKGLRHGYGVNAISTGVPLNMLCKWMGHADMKTTAIYANAIGDEEKGIAARMWT